MCRQACKCANVQATVSQISNILLKAVSNKHELCCCAAEKVVIPDSQNSFCIVNINYPTFVLFSVLLPGKGASFSRGRRYICCVLCFSTSRQIYLLCSVFLYEPVDISAAFPQQLISLWTSSPLCTSALFPQEYYSISVHVVLPPTM